MMPGGGSAAVAAVGDLRASVGVLLPAATLCRILSCPSPAILRRLVG